MLIVLAFHLLAIGFALRQDQGVFGREAWMLSVIVATHDSERALVATLAALVPGATAGIVREAIVADGGSHDETEQVADIAGCRFVSSPQALGVRLKAAAAIARGPWLMFLPAGLVPGPGWVDEMLAFMEKNEPRRAAVFASAGRDVLNLLRRAIGVLPGGNQGLIVAKSFYDEVGGHRDIARPGNVLLRRIGRRHLIVLRTAADWVYLT